MSLSQRMTRLLKGTGATYATVAKAAGCTDGQIGHFVKGIRKKLTAANLAGIATLFDVDMLWLATGKGKAPTAEHLRAVAAKRGFTRRGRATTEAAP